MSGMEAYINSKIDEYMDEDENDEERFIAYATIHELRTLNENLEGIKEALREIAIHGIYNYPC